MPAVEKLALGIYLGGTVLFFVYVAYVALKK